jgi:F0F1-type ATP synthase membrane subunit b/b'
MDAHTRIAHLLDWLEEAKTVPFSTSVMINREAFADELDAVRDELPAELRQAHLLLAERDEVLERARREAARILEDAREERQRLVSESELVRAAEREADEILAAARAEARRLRLEADDYIDGKLAGFEIVLHKALQTVERGRARLANRADREEQPDGEEEPAPPQGLFDHEAP